MVNPEPLNLEEINKADIISQAIVNSFAKCEWQESMPLGAIHLEALKLFENEVKRRIKSACEFYLEWRNDPKLFINWYEDKKKVDELLRFLEHHFGDEWYDDYDNEPCVKEKIVLKYNEWLFKLAFKDVLGDNND